MPVRCTSVRYTPARCTPVGYIPSTSNYLLSESPKAGMNMKGMNMKNMRRFEFLMGYGLADMGLAMSVREA